MSSFIANNRRFKEVRDGTGKLSPPESHVDNDYVAKTVVYNRKKNQKKGGREKKKKKKEVEEIQQ